MTREQTKALLHVLTAWADGKEVECRLSSTEKWQVVKAPSAYFESEFSLQWRIKPEPRRFWVLEYAESDLDGGTLHSTRASAEKLCYPGSKVVELVEVFNED